MSRNSALIFVRRFGLAGASSAGASFLSSPLFLERVFSFGESFSDSGFILAGASSAALPRRQLPGGRDGLPFPFSSDRKPKSIPA